MSLALGAPALADPSDTEEAARALGTAEVPAEDHHHEEESGPGAADRLVVEQEELFPAMDAPVPAEIEGVLPDLEDLPEKWLRGTPAGPVPTTGDTVPPTTDAVVPAPPRKILPSTLDATPGWQPTYSCDPNNKPGMVAFADLVSQHYDRPRYYTSRKCLSGDNSQHYEGRAVDWPMNAYNAEDKAIGDAVARWLTANNGEMARRFGVMSVIWNKRSWYVSDPGRWYDYSGPSPHTDHVHISFTWDGAMQRTSWWTGRAVTQVDQGTCRVYSLQYAPRYTGRRTSTCPTNLPSAPPSDYPVILPSAFSDTVATAQAHLGYRGLGVDGSFGPLTLQRLLDHQRAARLPVTGVLDNATWAEFARGVDRLAGTDRYGTAATLSLFTRTGRDVYVATGENYPDALAASARAGAVGGAVLLVQEGSIPKITADALTRAKPRRIYVMGGPGTVSYAVRESLERYTSTGEAIRVAGVNRYETAGLLARQFGTSVPVAYVATGTDYPDALVGAARAAYNDGPVLLTTRTTIPVETIAALRAIRPDRIVVVGGTAEVSGSVLSGLGSYARSGQVTRVGGSSHYETAADLSAFYPAGVDVVYVAAASTYSDGLSAAARAGHQDGPVLLTSPTIIPSVTKAALSRLQPRAIIVVGGRDRVSSEVLTALRAYAD